MAGRSYLGIDAGTSVVKAAIFDERGEALAVQGRPIPLMHERGGVTGAVEQDFDVILATLAAVVSDAVRESGTTPASIALTGQGDGCWITDDRFRPVRPAVSWLDGRASGLVDEWVRSGVTEEVFRISGGTMFPGAPAACLKWLDLNEPQTLDRAATAGYCKDMIFGRLTGERATDPSDASMPFGDGTGLAYSDRVLELTGLAHRRSLLAPIVAPVPVAELHAEGASLLGLPAGTPVTSGPFDFPACGFGGGMAWPGTEGDALMIVGTTLGCLVHLDELVTSGERAPFVDPLAAGQISGLRLTTNRDDLVRAVCEGLAYTARHCFAAAGRSGRIVVAGGGSKSSNWMQMFADVLEVPLELARNPEVGARGAVLAGAEARGEHLDVEAWTTPEGVVEPDEANRAVYDAGYARQMELLEAARPLWHTRAALAATGAER